MKSIDVVHCMLVLQLIQLVISQKCPSGDTIFVWGISQGDKQQVVNEHNKYRQAILAGTVPGQPKGKNILMMGFDNNLSNQARIVSQTCKMEHHLATDNRWNFVGQNLYISWSSVASCTPNWPEAVASWFNEYKLFRYPTLSSNTYHYTQVIWHDSSSLGCDFICFYDHTKPSFPYTKLYTCNYGPGGNIIGYPPYELA